MLFFLLNKHRFLLILISVDNQSGHFQYRILLGFDNKIVGVIPVGQQVSGLLVVHAYVEIREHAWEEVVDLSGDIQDVTNSATNNNNKQQVSPLQMIS